MGHLTIAQRFNAGFDERTAQLFSCPLGATETVAIDSATRTPTVPPGRKIILWLGRDPSVKTLGSIIKCPYGTKTNTDVSQVKIVHLMIVLDIGK